MSFVPYQPKTVLNKHKRADHWFWTRYSAYPYLGCQHGCEFCYCREQKYSPYDAPSDFCSLIKIKTNAPELLHRALQKAAVDVIFTGDYQPAERKFEISRKMLEVCREFGFPVFVLERSPLVLRDLDVLQDIHARAPSVVAFSVIGAPESPHYDAICRMERLAPKAEKRFAAMEKIAQAGLLTGACMMPLLPGLCDDRTNLEAIIRHTADHGGSFVLASSLTLADQQKEYFFDVLRERFPELLSLYQHLYPSISYAPGQYNWHEIACQIRELCEKHGIRDRMPRPIIPGDKKALNKHVVEYLADKIHEMEIQQHSSQRIWTYRKAAWAIEDLQQDIGLIYQTMGLKGLQAIPQVGAPLAKTVEEILRDRKYHELLR